MCSCIDRDPTHTILARTLAHVAFLVFAVPRRKLRKCRDDPNAPNTFSRGTLSEEKGAMAPP